MTHGVGNIKKKKKCTDAFSPGSLLSFSFFGYQLQSNSLTDIIFPQEGGLRCWDILFFLRTKHGSILIDILTVNSRTRSADKPHALHGSPQHSQRLVFCAKCLKDEL